MIWLSWKGSGMRTQIMQGTTFFLFKVTEHLAARKAWFAPAGRYRKDQNRNHHRHGLSLVARAAPLSPRCEPNGPAMRYREEKTTKPCSPSIESTPAIGPLTRPASLQFAPSP